MSSQDIHAGHFAKAFHYYHQALAPDFSCTHAIENNSWETLPTNERARLVAAVRLALMDSASRHQDPESQDDRRRYFAKPGEAE